MLLWFKIIIYGTISQKLLHHQLQVKSSHSRNLYASYWFVYIRNTSLVNVLQLHWCGLNPEQIAAQEIVLSTEPETGNIE